MHEPVTALRPVAAQKEPAVHGADADKPSAAHSCPIGHAAIAAAPLAQNDPAVHACCVAEDAPAGQYEPAELRDGEKKAVKGGGV